EISMEIGEKYGVALMSGNIGTLNTMLGNYNEALNNFNKALNLSNKLGLESYSVRLYSYLVELYIKFHKYKKAIENNDLLLAISSKLNDLECVRKSQIYKIKVKFNYLDKKNIDKLESVKSLEKIVKESKDEEVKAQLNYEIVKMYAEINKIDKAKEYSKVAVKLLKKLYKKKPKIIYKNYFEELESMKF
ncbi:MAG: tetratricopeptide repeat protein, partial [Candidatus Delongbacteria bacterium]|nr:tetratricopeptide repeat protein [Candidatus Delongbacteria bacterium]